MAVTTNQPAITASSSLTSQHHYCLVSLNCYSITLVVVKLEVSTMSGILMPVSTPPALTHNLLAVVESGLWELDYHTRSHHRSRRVALVLLVTG